MKYSGTPSTQSDCPIPAERCEGDVSISLDATVPCGDLAYPTNQHDIDDQDKHDPARRNDGQHPSDLTRGGSCLTIFRERVNGEEPFSYRISRFVGDGVPIDFNASAEYLKQSSDQGNPDGRLFCAAHYFKLCADQRNAFGELFYGICLHDGLEVRIDQNGAAHYYRLSGDHDNALGLLFYGISLWTGCGVPIDGNLAAQ
jgi:hypothetical protein